VFLHGQKIRGRRIEKERKRYRIGCASPRTLQCEYLNLPVVDFRLKLAPLVSLETLPECIRIRTPCPTSTPLVLWDRASPSPWTKYQTNELYTTEGQSSSGDLGAIRSVLQSLEVNPAGPDNIRLATQGSPFTQFLELQDYQSGYTSDVMDDAQPRPVTSSRAESNPMTSAYVLNLLNIHVAPLVGNFMIDISEANSVDSLPLVALYGPRTTSILSNQTLNLRVVYMVMFALANHMVDLERLSDRFSGSAFDHFIRRGVKQFNSMNPRHFVQILDCLPKPYSLALEEGLFSAAIELGYCKVVDIILSRGLDPNQFAVLVEGIRFTPLERACKHLSLEVVHTLLRRGADPNRYFNVPIISSVVAHLQSPRDEGWGLVTTLLKAGLQIDDHVLITFRRHGMSTFYRICAEHLDPIHFMTCVRGDFLASTIYFCDDERLATRVVKAFLDSNWEQEMKEQWWFTRALRRALCAALFMHNTEAFTTLLKAGAQAAPECLSIAIRCVNMPAVRYFLNQGTSVVDTGETDRFEGATSYDLMVPIAQMIRSTSTAIQEVFWECGMIGKLVGNYDATVQSIIAACESGNERILTALLSIWEDWPQQELHSRPISSKFYIEEAFSRAIIERHEKLIPKLLEAGICPGNQALCAALRISDTSIINVMLDAIPDPSFTGNDSPYSPVSDALHWAVMSANTDVIQQLISAGFPMNCWQPPEEIQDTCSADCPTGYWPLLSTAIFCQDQVVIDLLLENGCPLEHTHCPRHHDMAEDVIDPLLAAVWAMNHSVLQTLISRGANSCNEAALQIAASIRDRRTVSILLDASIGSDPVRKKGFGAEALWHAVRNEDLDMLELLIQFVDIKHLRLFDPRAGIRTAAFAAAISLERPDSLLMTEIFVKRYEDLNTIIAIEGIYDSATRSITPLLSAIATGKIEKVRFLVEMGASIHTPAKLGIRRTPLQSAAEHGTLDIVNYLLEQGADPNEAPALRGGGTALQLAAGQGFIGIVSMLILRGADINAPAGMLLGHTAFEAAAKYGRIEMLMFLIESGADIVSDGGKQRRRAVLFAKENGFSGIVSLVEILYAEACKIAGNAILSSFDEAGELLSGALNFGVELGGDFQS